MIPYNPLDLHVLWFNAWREHIRQAKERPEYRDNYCWAAEIAQMKYVTELALKMGRILSDKTD